jgi:excisionase family DNA binding protein
MNTSATSEQSGRRAAKVNQLFECESTMQTSTAEFINLTAFAKAVAIHLMGFLNEVLSTKRIYTLDEAAEYCGLTRDGFKKKVIRNRIRRVRLDKCWRFNKSDLDAWIESHKDHIAEETAA